MMIGGGQDSCSAGGLGATRSFLVLDHRRSATPVLRDRAGVGAKAPVELRHSTVRGARELEGATVPARRRLGGVQIGKVD